MKLSYRKIELALARKKMNFNELKSINKAVILANSRGLNVTPKVAGTLAEELGVDVEKIESNELLEELEIALRGATEDEIISR